MSEIKNEIKLEDGTSIKPEPDDSMDYVSDVEVEDEDTGELKFPRTAPPHSWLMRVPRDLWFGLSAMNSEGQIQIGELWEWKDEKTGKITTRWKISPDLPGFDLVAKEYDLQTSKTASNPATSNSTFVFSEKETFGKSFFGRGVKQERDVVKKTTGGRIDKRHQQYRGPRSIPKHTVYVAAPEDEVSCHPRENDEWFALQQKKDEYTRANRARLGRVGLEKAKKDAQDTQHDDFLRISDPTSKKPRKMEDKFQRVDEAQLMTMLENAFKLHKYWGMKALKAHVKQPEAYLREVLSRVAVLIKGGVFANTWTLKTDMSGVIQSEEALEAFSRQQDPAAAEQLIAQDISGDDYDDDEMEDVVID